MKLVVNARFLTQPITGVQQYALRFAVFLKKNSTTDITFVSPRGIMHPELAKTLEVTEIGYTEGFVWEQIELPMWLKKNGSPLLINFGNVAPQHYSNQVVTIHDLSTIDHPEWYSKRFATAYKMILPAIIRNARLVLAVSETTKKRILELYDVSPEKVKVIYNTIEIPEEMYEPQSPHTYFVTVGSFNNRKNLLNLVKAFEEASISGFELKIRTSREDIYKEDREAFEYISGCKNVHLVDALNYQAYMDLVRNSRLMINLALYEGFGMPNLEALALGVPLVCSDIPVFREVCGDEAYYADPGNSGEVQEILKQVSAKVQYGHDIEARRKRAEKFTMQQEGTKLVGILNACIE